jgi:hypothetical protein
MVQLVSTMKIYQESMEDSLVGLMYKHKNPSMAIKIPGIIMCVCNPNMCGCGQGQVDLQSFLISLSSQPMSTS